MPLARGGLSSALGTALSTTQAAAVPWHQGEGLACTARRQAGLLEQTAAEAHAAAAAARPALPRPAAASGTWREELGRQLRKALRAADCWGRDQQRSGKLHSVWAQGRS